MFFSKEISASLANLPNLAKTSILDTRQQKQNSEYTKCKVNDY